jgi:hypothetical protein
VNLQHAVQQVAPLAPPCFESRLQWLTYLVSAAQAHVPNREPGPLVIRAGEPVTFNCSFDFCQDCEAGWRREQRVVERGACKPHWLRQFDKTKETASC